jgi:hypothetical protein
MQFFLDSIGKKRFKNFFTSNLSQIYIRLIFLSHVRLMIGVFSKYKICIGLLWEIKKMIFQLRGSDVHGHPDLLGDEVSRVYQLHTPRSRHQVNPPNFCEVVEWKSFCHCCTLLKKGGFFWWGGGGVWRDFSPCPHLSICLWENVITKWRQKDFCSFPLIQKLHSLLIISAYGTL